MSGKSEGVPAPVGTDAIAVGQHIMTLRALASRGDFAKRVGVGLMSLGRYERGERIPKRVVLERIARTCGVSVAWLLTGEASRPPPPSTDYVEHLRETIRALEARCASAEALIAKLTRGGS